MGVGLRFPARGVSGAPVCGVLAEGIDGPYIIIHNYHYGYNMTPEIPAPHPRSDPVLRPSPRPPRSTRRLADHSLSPNTRDAYARALRQFDAWRGPEVATDATLAAYLGWLFEQGRAPATAALVVAAVTFRATLAGPRSAGPRPLACWPGSGATGPAGARPRRLTAEGLAGHPRHR